MSAGCDGVSDRTETVLEQIKSAFAVGLPPIGHGLSIRECPSPVLTANPRRGGDLRFSVPMGGWRLGEICHNLGISVGGISTEEIKAMLKLFYAPNTCSLASHIALEEAGAAYATVRVDFSRSEQRQPEYLAINPKGRVPALVTDRGILTETPAILVFIAQSYPEAALVPLHDPFAFAQAQAFNSYLCSTVHVAHAHRMRGERWADDPAAIAEMKRKVPQSVGAAYDLIERDMLKGPWVMGDVYTICNPYLFTMSEWLEGDGVDLSRLPKVIDHRNRMSERPAVRKAIAEERG